MLTDLSKSTADLAFSTGKEMSWLEQADLCFDDELRRVWYFRVDHCVPKNYGPVLKADQMSPNFSIRGFVLEELEKRSRQWREVCRLSLCKV